MWYLSYHAIFKMKRNGHMEKKIFITHFSIENNQLVLKNDDYNYLINVMRMSKNDKVIAVSQTQKTKIICKILKTENQKVFCEIIEKLPLTTDSKTITIIQGIPKAQKMEYIIQKCTELGASEFIPLNLKRNVVKIENKIDKKLQRWQKIAQEASRQSKRDIVPTINKPHNLSELKEIYQNHEFNIILWEHEKKQSIKDIFMQTKHINSISFTIGAEGGISSEEIAILNTYGGKTASLGKNILRTETAPISIISMFNYAYLL